MYYDKHFFDWYENIYLRNKDEHYIKQRKLAASKKKKVAALQKSIADNQALIKYLSEKKTATYMETLSIKLRNHKASTSLTLTQLADLTGVTINAIQKHLNNEIKYRSKYTKAIEKYLANTCKMTYN